MHSTQGGVVVLGLGGCLLVIEGDVFTIDGQLSLVNGWQVAGAEGPAQCECDVLHGRGCAGGRQCHMDAGGLGNHCSWL